jgi:hypothetical protein
VEELYKQFFIFMAGLSFSSGVYCLSAMAGVHKLEGLLSHEKARVFIAASLGSTFSWYGFINSIFIILK